MQSAITFLSHCYDTIRTGEPHRYGHIAIVPQTKHLYAPAQLLLAIWHYDYLENKHERKQWRRECQRITQHALRNSTLHCLYNDQDRWHYPPSQSRKTLDYSHAVALLYKTRTHTPTLVPAVLTLACELGLPATDYWYGTVALFIQNDELL